MGTSATSTEDGREPGYRPALAVDVSEWDDPDYEFLAFKGRDRPFRGRECGGEPGEEVDKARVAAKSGKVHASRVEAGHPCATGRWTLGRI